MTKKQKAREWCAVICDDIAGGKGKSDIARQQRAKNRAVDKRKGFTSRKP